MDGGIAQSIPSRFRDVGLPHITLRDQLSHCSGGGILRIREIAVVIALPTNGQRFHGTFVLDNGAAILHRQNVVGILQQGSIHSHLFQCTLPCNRERTSTFQLLPQKWTKFRAKQCLCRNHQRVGIPGLTAKAEVVTDRGEDLHTAFSKPFRRGQRIRNRQFQNQICAAVDSGSGTEGLVKNSRHTPLNEVTAHQADDQSILPKPGANMVKLLLMPQVKGVIFTDNADDFQKNPSFSKKVLPWGLRNQIK